MSTTTNPVGLADVGFSLDDPETNPSPSPSPPPKARVDLMNSIYGRSTSLDGGVSMEPPLAGVVPLATLMGGGVGGVRPITSLTLRGFPRYQGDTSSTASPTKPPPSAPPSAAVVVVKVGTGEGGKVEEEEEEEAKKPFAFCRPLLCLVLILALALGLGLGLGLKSNSGSGLPMSTAPSSAPSASSRKANVSSYNNVTIYTTTLETLLVQSTSVDLQLSITSLTPQVHSNMRCDLADCLSSYGLTLGNVRVSSSRTLDQVNTSVSALDPGNTATTCPGSTTTAAAADGASTTTTGGRLRLLEGEQLLVGEQRDPSTMTLASLPLIAPNTPSLLLVPPPRQLQQGTTTTAAATTANATNSTVCSGATTANPLSNLVISLDNFSANTSTILALLANYSFPSTMAAIAANASCLVPSGGNLSTVLGVGPGAFRITNTSYATQVNVTKTTTTLVEVVEYLDVTTASSSPTGSGMLPTASSRPYPTVTRPVDGTTTQTQTSTRTGTKSSRFSNPAMRTRASSPTNLGAGYAAAAQGGEEGDPAFVAAAPPPPGTATGSISTSASPSASGSASASPPASPSTSASATLTASSSASASTKLSPSGTVSPTTSRSPINTRSAPRTASVSGVPSGAGELTITPEPTISDWWGTEAPLASGDSATTFLSTASPSSGVSVSSSHCPSASQSSQLTQSGTPTASSSPSPSITPSSSSSTSATSSASPTPTSTTTFSATPTLSWTDTTSPSAWASVASYPASVSGGTVSGTGSLSLTVTQTFSPSAFGSGSRTGSDVGSGTGTLTLTISGSTPPSITMSVSQCGSGSVTQSNGAPSVTPTYATPVTTFTPSQSASPSVSPCPSGSVTVSPPATVTVGSPSSTVSVATGSGSASAPVSPSAASPSPTPSAATLSPSGSLSLTASPSITPTLSSTLCPSSSTTSTPSTTLSPCHSPSPTYAVPTTTLSTTLCLSTTPSSSGRASPTHTSTASASATASATATAWSGLRCDAVACYLGLAGSYDSDTAMSTCSALAPPASGAAWDSTSITDDATFASVVTSGRCGGSFASTTVYWTGLTYTGGVFSPFSSYNWKSGADTTYFSTLSVNKNFGKRLKVDGGLESANDGDSYAACCQYYLVASVTSTKTATLSPSSSPSGSGVGSSQPSPTPASTGASTGTVSPSPTASLTSTHSSTPSGSGSPSGSPSSTRSPARTRTNTPSATSTTTASASPTLTHSKPGTPSQREGLGMGGSRSASTPPNPSPSSIATLSATATASATAAAQDPCPLPDSCRCGLWFADTFSQPPKVFQKQPNLSCPQNSVNNCCFLPPRLPPISTIIEFKSYRGQGLCGSGPLYCTTTSNAVNPPIKGLPLVAWPRTGCQPELGFCNPPPPVPTSLPSSSPQTMATLSGSGSASLTSSSSPSPSSSASPLGSEGSSTGSASATPSPPQGGGSLSSTPTPPHPSSCSTGSAMGTGSATGSGTSTASATASATATIPPLNPPPAFPALGAKVVTTWQASLATTYAGQLSTPPLTAVAAVQDSSGTVFALVGNSLVMGDSKGGGFKVVCGRADREGFSDGVCSPTTSGNFKTPTVVTWGGGDMVPYSQVPCILFIGDTGNHAVRVAKIQNIGGGFVSTTLSTLTGFAAAGAEGGFQDGPCASALFLTPSGIALVPPPAASNTYATLKSPLSSGGRALVNTAVTQLLVCDGDNGAVRLVTFRGSPISPALCTVEAYAGYMADQPSGQGNNVGSGGSSYVEGPLLTARFKSPAGIAMSRTTPLLAYLIDQGNGVVRVIDTGAQTVGTLLDLVQTVYKGRDTTPFATPLYPFTNPVGLAVTPGGAVVLPDNGEYSWLLATASGWPPVVLAGAGWAGKSDGAGANAQFSGPTGVACDPAGNLVVADSGNARLRYISYAVPIPVPTPSPRASLSPTKSPAATPTPTPFYWVTTLAGSGATSSLDGTGAGASFLSPAGPAVDPRSGEVYVGDSSNRVRVVTREGKVSSLAGRFSGYVKGQVTDGTGTNALILSPQGMAVDGGTGAVFFCDSGLNCIRKLSKEGVVTTLAGIIITTPAAFADGIGSAATFNKPENIAMDASSGSLYVADTLNCAIRVVTSEGSVTTFAGAPPCSRSADGSGIEATFNNPRGLAVDSFGVVFVADSFNNRVRRISPRGVVTTFAGSGQQQPVRDGLGAAAVISNPTGVAVDARGNVFVCDFNNRIRMVSPGGAVVTIAGASTSSVFSDGAGIIATFKSPSGIAMDASGVLFVSDRGFNKVRRLELVLSPPSTPPIPSASLPATLSRTLSPSPSITPDPMPTKVSPSALPSPTPFYWVTTLAGSGSSSFADGTGSGADFYAPTGVSVDITSGAVYVGDRGNSRLRMVMNNGVVSSLAGQKKASAASLFYSDGTGIAAILESPRGVAFYKATGALLVADAGSHSIRSVSAQGVVATLAGLNNAKTRFVPPFYTSGFADGTGKAAGFNTPSSLALDTGGVIYVADALNCALRTVTLGGSVATLAGRGCSTTSTPTPLSDGVGTFATFFKPNGVAVDLQGAVFVADSGFHLIRKVTPKGLVTTLAGSGSSSPILDGLGVSATFNFPSGIAFDSTGNLFICDQGSNRIRMMSPGGAVVTIAGASTSTDFSDGTGDKATFNGPAGIAVGSKGILFVADMQNNVIRKLVPLLSPPTVPPKPTASRSASPTGTTSLTISTARSPSPSFTLSRSVSGTRTRSTTISPSRTSTRSVTPSAKPSIPTPSPPSTPTASGMATPTVPPPAPMVYTLAGGAYIPGTKTFPDGVGSEAVFAGLRCGATDANGVLYVSDVGQNRRVRKVTPGGVVTTLAGGGTSSTVFDGAGAAAVISIPQGLVVDSKGFVFVADGGLHCIRRVSPEGVVTTFAGAQTNGPPSKIFKDGSGNDATFASPFGLALESTGVLYVGDSNYNRVRMVTPSGVVTTYAGSGASTPFSDGAALSATFSNPHALALRSSGVLFVADPGNNRIRAITPKGIVTTVAGSGASSPFLNGPASGATFQYPRGIAVDSSGVLYVADTNNFKIRMITPGGVVTTYAGSGASSPLSEGPGGGATFTGPYCVAEHRGVVYVIDGTRVRKIEPPAAT